MTDKYAFDAAVSSCGVVRRSSWLLGLAVVLALTGSSAVSSAVRGGTPSAEGFAIQVSVPGQGGSTAGAVSGPPTRGVSGAFAYPADGSAVSASAVSSRVTTGTGATTTASSSVSVDGITLFGGEVTIASVRAKASARATAKGAAGDTSGTAVNAMTVAGQPVTVTPGASVALGDWGTASFLQQTASAYTAGKVRGYTARATALQVHLNADHAGLPAGTDIVIGYVEAAAEPAPPAVEPAPVEEKSPPKPRRAKKTTDPKTKPPDSADSLPVRPPPVGIIPRLTANRYVFPIYGSTSFVGTFGAPRSGNVGWHHGTDIFASLAAPVLAAADGVIYSVGWNNRGGLRLWLQDTAGNEFYYAHMSAYSPLAVNGTQVRAGDVLGFVGNTGDAQGTPYHLHFEIHPVSRLYLGYDGGAVEPYPYLLAWRRLTDVSLNGVAGWSAPLADSSRAPKPGAILIQARDISNASGLDHSSLHRVLRPSDGQLGQPQTRDAEPAGSGP